MHIYTCIIIQECNCRNYININLSFTKHFIRKYKYMIRNYKFCLQNFTKFVIPTHQLFYKYENIPSRNRIMLNCPYAYKLKPFFIFAKWHLLHLHVNLSKWGYLKLICLLVKYVCQIEKMHPRRPAITEM